VGCARVGLANAHQRNSSPGDRLTAGAGAARHRADDVAGWLAFANVGCVTRRRGVGATHYRDVSQDFTLTREARW
jgi:hypothetical protein